MYKIKKQNQGFILVEAMVSVTILLIVIIAPLTLAYQIEKISRLASTRAQATYLANEGVELVIFFRKSLETYCTTNPGVDECALGPSAATTSFAMFLNKMSYCVDAGANYCRFDKTSFIPTLATYTDNPACTILYNNSSGEFVCNSTATSTRFSRYISMQKVDRWKDRSSNNQWFTGVKVISTVCYDRGICNDKMQVTSYVYQ